MAETQSGGPGIGASVRDEPEPPRARIRWHLLLLLIPFAALLYPPWYAHLTPRFLGIPFFIWYQFAWVIGGVLVTGLVYAIDRGLTRDQG